MESCNPRTQHTPECFMAVLEVASENRDAVVIHGWLHHQGEWILHAWCEFDEWVIDLTEAREPIAKSAYYQTMGVTPERFVRYERQEFFALAAKHGHFGPFDKVFFSLEKTSQDPLKIVVRENTKLHSHPK